MSARHWDAHVYSASKACNALQFSCNVREIVAENQFLLFSIREKLFDSSLDSLIIVLTICTVGSIGAIRPKKTPDRIPSPCYGGFGFVTDFK